MRLVDSLRLSVKLVDFLKRGETAEQITTDDARVLLERIDAAAQNGSIEMAGLLESQLHRRVLRAVAAGVPDSRRLAGIACLTNELVFDRVDV